jgi:hypothetical protein
MGVLLGLSLASYGPLSAQDYVFETGEVGIELERRGSLIVVEALGPRLFRTGPIILEHGALHNRWIVVQDSTMGVVFTEPSGVKVSSPDYDGDVDLRALTSVVAIEVRALLFNVWGEFAGHVGVTRLVEQRIGETWAMDPRWTEVGAPAGEHRTSIMWIHRVMFGNESIFEADLAVVEAAARELTGGTMPEIGDPVSAVLGR